MLLLEFGSEDAFPEPIKEIWLATKGWGADKDRIYRALQKLTRQEIERIQRVPGLFDILNDELSGEDLQAAKDLLSGVYADLISIHKRNVALVKKVLEYMQRPDQPTLVRNTAEWLLPGTPGAEPRTRLYILTLTHDSGERAIKHGYKASAAYFGNGHQFPDDSATYDPHISSKRNIGFVPPRFAGTYSDNEIRLYHPERFSLNDVRRSLIHEVQHAADLDDSKTLWSSYKSEFRAYWIDTGSDHLSAASGTATNPKFDNARQEVIFLHLYDSYDWLRLSYDENIKVNGQNFQDLVHGFTRPEGVNLINSLRIDNFLRELQKCNPDHTNLTSSPLKELDAATDALNADDRNYINSLEAAPLQGMMKSNLGESVLKHIATKINNGTEPAWAR